MNDIEKLNMIAEWQEQHKQLIEDLDNSKKRIAELEKENAELKKKNLDTQDAVAMQMYTNKANKEIADRQLTKAKELLGKLLKEEENNMYWEMNGSDKSSYYEVRKQAEQFFKGVTMFEKEAEKYADKQTGCGDGYYEWTDVKQSFKDGAEFGYNKANEWHYVKDGDLPKEYDKPYLCKVYSHFEVGYFTAYKDQPWHFDEYYLDNEDVIAWKEIVLPN